MPLPEYRDHYADPPPRPPRRVRADLAAVAALVAFLAGLAASEVWPADAPPPAEVPVAGAMAWNPGWWTERLVPELRRPGLFAEE